MEKQATPLVGVGLYTVAEASKLTGTPARTIRRWARGYSYRRNEKERKQPPVWRADLEPIRGQQPLTFLDLMEARFIRSFREYGVSWPAIREAARRAQEMYEDRHAFTRHRFRTDGKAIFQQIEEEGHVKLFDLNRETWVFREMVEPSLYAGVEFHAEQMARWYPVESRSIVIDPALAFGRPILAKEGVSTEIIAAEVAANDNDEDAIARWYKIPARAVRAAVEYEASLRPDKRLAA